MDPLAQLSDQTRRAQEKYDYWLMAVAASCIALAVHNTRSSPLKWSLLPLAFAVAAWALSFIAGCCRQSLIEKFMNINVQQLQLQAGTHPNAGGNPEAINLGLGETGNALARTNTKLTAWRRVQFWFLVGGAASYLIWHILEMGLRT